MEDVLEIIPALIVVAISIAVSAKKSKKGKRPGQSAKPQPAPRQKRRPAPAARPAIDVPEPAGPAEAMAPEDMTPEDMTPEAMTPPPVEMAMREGESASDAAGCVGGSLPHDEGVHQGVEFHAEGTHGPAVRPARQPAQNRRPEPAAPGLSPAEMRRAVVWAEIFDRPVSMRR